MAPDEDDDYELDDELDEDEADKDDDDEADDDELDDDEPLYVDCGEHGERIAAVVCCHMLESDEPVGFVENSDDPNDLQAWCDQCEEMFLAEGDKTPAFEEFNDRAIVCVVCYDECKALHSR